MTRELKDKLKRELDVMRAMCSGTLLSSECYAVPCEKPAAGSRVQSCQEPREHPPQVTQPHSDDGTSPGNGI
jgi:hypothetical protein